MNADDVRALVAAMYPEAMKSPFAQMVRQIVSWDEAARAVEFARLQARASEREYARIRAEAMQHAESCLDAIDGWTVETLSNNIASSFWEGLSEDDCDAIAKQALTRGAR